MRVSIFTPTHDPKYLDELYESIKDQDFYEWIIVPNGGCEPIVKFQDDARVKIIPYNSHTGNIGDIKRFSALRCTGDVFLELDHDDLLVSTAIAEVQEAFSDPEVGFVYSNFAEFTGDFQKTPRYDARNGWKWRPFFYKGFELDEVISFPTTPATVSKIWYAPNHLRAWRAEVYYLLGGHDTTMKVLDDLDLLCRTYNATKIKHINRCLYLYRVHGKNSWLRFNDEIQVGTMQVYSEYITSLCLTWAKQNNLKALDLGGAINPAEGFEVVDLQSGVDLNKPFPFADNSVGVIRAYDFLEHIADKLHVIKEIYRVLAPGGYLLSMTPSAEFGQAAFQDPTHVSFYVENSFRYYTEENFAKYIGTPVKFQAINLYTTKLNRDRACWVVADLVALKGQEVTGIVKI